MGRMVSVCGGGLACGLGSRISSLQCQSLFFLFQVRGEGGQGTWL